MGAPSTPLSGLTTAVRNYWWTSAFGGLYFCGGFIAWGGTRGAIVSSGLFFVVAMVGLAIHYRVSWKGRWPRVALILAHLLIGQLILNWQQTNLPLSDYTVTGGPADREFMIYLVSALIVGTMSMFGGILGALLGLGLHYGLIFDIRESFSFKWGFPVLIAVAGNIVSTALWRLDQAYAQLQKLANHDHLTGLYNRHRLSIEFARLQGEARRAGESLLVVAWDLDDLKRVNDAQGHAAGDELIRRFARALQAHVRHDADVRNVDAAFRVGGDEFISMHRDVADGELLMTRVHEVFPAVSAGWVRCEALTLDEALTRADAAMYAFKNRKRPGLPAGTPRSIRVI